LELWKANNVFKIFLLSFVVAFLVLILLFHNIAASRYLLVVLFVNVLVYVAFFILPLLQRLKIAEQPRQKKRKDSPGPLSWQSL